MQKALLFIFTIISFSLFTFKTVAQSYCNANGADNNFEWIASVDIAGLSFTSGADNGGYFYVNDANIELSKGDTYDFSLTPAYASTVYEEYWRIWIDYNDDGDFTDPNELVFDAGNASTTTVNGDFTVPTNINNSTTRMRVIMKYVDINDSSAPNSCGTFEFGEVEDFSVIISEGNTDSTDDPSPYCVSEGNANDEWIQSVSIGNFSYNSGNNNGYGNHTDQGTISLLQGSSNALNLVTGYSGDQYEEYWKIWIDFNKDNDFNDSGELVFDAGLGNTGTLNSTLNIPENATLGNTRLRVVMKGLSDTDNAAPNSCGEYNFGETEDYLVNIQTGSTGSNDDPAPYCAASGDSQAEWIETVQFENLNFNTGNGGGYENNTNTVIPLNISQAIDFTLTPGFADQSYTERWRIWIDFNDDEDFNDAGELVFDAPTAISTTVTGTLDMDNATSGNHRMRIAMKYNGSFSDGTSDNTPPNACGTFDFGEVEDYTVSISGSTVQTPVCDFNANVTSGVAPLTVNFQDLSSNSPTSWTWLFTGGNPTSSTIQNPTVLYNTPGVYNVTLTAANSAGSDSETKQGYIVVTEEVVSPVADFTANITNGNAPLTVNFQDLSSNTPTAWSWSFSGGNPINSTVQNPTVIYNTPGVYNVTLTASNSAGSDTETKQSYIVVTEEVVSPVADFTANITNGNAPLTVNFQDLSSNTPTAWSWSFTGGNPTNSTVQNPTVIYNTPGVYNVTLTASNSAGSDSETKQGYVVVTEAAVSPVANFTANTTSGNAPLTVNFQDLSSNTPTAWSWSFTGGNPTNSTVQNPTVIYNTPGVYNVTLTASNSAGSDSETKQGYVVVTEAAVSPVANFTANTTSGNAPLTVNFQDLSSNTPTSWTWLFTGGSPTSSTVQNPTVVYNSPGVYSVTLTASNSAGSDSETKEAYIVVTAENNIPTPTISVDNNPICIEDTGTPETATLTSSINPPSGYIYQWQLNGVNISPSSGGNDASITTSILGNYQLYFTDNNGSNGNISNTITLTNTDCSESTVIQAPVITSDYTSICTSGTGTPTTAIISSLSTPPQGYIFQWQFNGVNISANSGGNNSSFTTSTSGAYTLKFVGSGTNESAVSNTINITAIDCTNNNIIADFYASIYEGEAPLTVTFFDQSINEPTNWSWEFPGAIPATSIEKNPTVIYQNEGVFSVTLTVGNGTNENTITKTGIIVVSESTAIEIIDDHIVELTLFPNPSDGIFTVSLKNFESHDLELSLYSLDGKLIINKALPYAKSHSIPLDISEYPAGVYAIVIQDGKNIIQERLTKF